MCIRDSISTYLYVLIYIQSQGSETVSYEFPDVYKRQILMRFRKPSKSKGKPPVKMGSWGDALSLIHIYGFRLILYWEDVCPSLESGREIPVGGGAETR